MSNYSAEKVKEFRAMAEKWFSNCTAKVMFHDCQRITKLSVMEYLANQKGYTVYKNLASCIEDD